MDGKPLGRFHSSRVSNWPFFKGRRHVAAGTDDLHSGRREVPGPLLAVTDIRAGIPGDSATAAETVAHDARPSRPAARLFFTFMMLPCVGGRVSIRRPRQGRAARPTARAFHQTTRP